MSLGTFDVMLLALIVAFAFIVMVFLPSIIEIKKPRDRGPRRIQRSSLQRSVVRSPKLVAIPKPDSSSLKQGFKDLQQILSEVGVKSRRIGKDTVRILESVEFEPNFEIMDNVVIEGALKTGAKCVFHGSIKTTRDAIIGDGVVIKGNLIALGDVRIGDDVVVGGSVHSEGRVTLGEKTHVGLAVVAVGDVEICENSEVNRNILTRGTVKVLKHPKVDLPPTMDEID